MKDKSTLNKKEPPSVGSGSEAREQKKQTLSKQVSPDQPPVNPNFQHLIDDGHAMDSDGNLVEIPAESRKGLWGPGQEKEAERGLSDLLFEEVGAVGLHWHRVKSIPVESFVAEFYPNLQLKPDGPERCKALCPFHEDTDPSLVFFRKEQRWHCFGPCGSIGSHIDFLVKDGIASSPRDAVEKIAEKFIPVSKPKPKLSLDDYGNHLNIPKDFLVLNFGLVEAPHGIDFPYRDEHGNEVGIQIRHCLDKTKRDTRFSWKGGQPYLYGAWMIPTWLTEPNPRVILCEGASDVQVCWYRGFHALGVPGAQLFKEKWANLLLSIPEIIIVQEPDKAGETFVQTITTALKKFQFQGQVKVVKLPQKDLRDLWIKYGGGFDEELERARSSAPVLDLPPGLSDRLIHPALHIEKGFSSVGVVTREGNKNLFSILTSSGHSYLAEHVEDALTVTPIKYPSLLGRWRQSSKFENLSGTIALLIEKMRELVWFEDERWYPAISTWSAGTYLFQAFPAFPYLHLTGEKGSGKTKVQDVLECVAFNALKMVGPSPAILFRAIHALRPTLLVDEAERMNSEQAKEVRSILNAGYKRGATVPRCEGEDYDLKFFEVYCPKCLAGTRGLGAITEDRCITVVMAKPPSDDLRQNRAVDLMDDIWATIRDGLYQLPLRYADQVLQGFDNTLLPSWLRARDRELWLPLLQLAVIVDKESGLGIFDDILGLAGESTQEKGLTFEAEAILGLLESMFNGQDILRVHPVDLVPGLEGSLNRKGRISPEWIAGRLRGLGFKKADPPRDNQGVVYQVSAGKLAEMRCRFTPPKPTYTQPTRQPTQT